MAGALFLFRRNAQISRMLEHLKRLERARLYAVLASERAEARENPEEAAIWARRAISVTEQMEATAAELGRRSPMFRRALTRNGLGDLVDKKD